MGIGPAPATQKLLARLNMTIDQFDVIELNEAFASQGLAVLRALGVADDDARVNPNGGAIALGHPLAHERRASGDHRDVSTAPHARPFCAVHDVYRRRSRHRDRDRTCVTVWRLCREAPQHLEGRRFAYSVPVAAS